MTTTASGRQRTSACDGVTRTFANPDLLTAGDLQVYLLNDANAANEAGTLLSLGADYVISADLATITTTIAQPIGKFIRRWRETSREQVIEIRTNAGLPAATQEGALDRLSLVDEEISDDFEQRSIRGRTGERFDPLPANRAGLFLMFGVDGKPTVGVSLAAMAIAQGIGANFAMIGDTLQVSVPAAHNPYDHGAIGDGAANDRPAFVAIDAAIINPLQGFRVLAGDYRIAADLTINRDLFVEPGARFIIPNGVTLTLNGRVNAGVQHLFVCTGTGKVVFNWRKTSTGYMEWWGATSDLSAPCDTAWNAAHTALHRVLGQPGDYLFAATPKIPGPHMGFIGCGHRFTDGVYQVTRLVVTGGALDGVQIGPDAYPGSINAMPQGIEARDFYAGRTVAPVIASACKGVRVQYTLGAVLRRIKSQDSMSQFLFYGTVSTKCFDLEANRALAGTGAGADYWRAFDIDGSAAIGAAGGNASLYLLRPIYGCNLPALSAAEGYGLYITGNFTDVFVDEPEGVSCYCDIRIIGNNGAGNNSGNADLRISGATSDAFQKHGIWISDVAAAGVVQIKEFYLGPAPAARSSLRLDNCQGAVVLLGGEMDHYGAPLVQAVQGTTVKGLQLLGTVINEAGNSYPVIGIADLKNSILRPLIKNVAHAAAEAVQLTGTPIANVIEPVVMGMANAFTKGIDVVGVADVRNEYRCTGIDSDCLNGGSNKKLTRNAVAIVATGLSGTNLVGGVMT